MTSVLDDYVNPNETRVLEQQVRGALAWNLHAIAFHHDADDEMKRHMVERLIATATSKIGKDAVKDIVAGWTKRVEAATRG